MAQILHAALNQHRRDSGIPPHESASRAFGINAVYEKIDGRQEIKAHGTREMPIWGYRYMPQAINPYLEDPSYGLAQLLIQIRILSIIDYLDRVQEQ